MVTVSMCGDVCLNMLMGAIEVEGPSRVVAGVARDNRKAVVMHMSVGE